MRRQHGRGKKTRSFSEDVSNQLGTLARHFHPSSAQKKGSVCRAHWGQKVVWGASCNRVCVFVCELGGRGSRGSAPKTFFFSFFVAGFSSWSLWLSDSGAQWHFLIGFPSHPLVASALAQQSQGHNHSCAGPPRDTAHTLHAYKLYAHYQISLQLLISNYCSNLALSEPRGTHTDLGYSQLCALSVQPQILYYEHSFLTIWWSRSQWSYTTAVRNSQGKEKYVCLKDFFKTTFCGSCWAATAAPQALQRVNCCRSFELFSSAGFKRTQPKSQGKDKASVEERDTLRGKDLRHACERERGKRWEETTEAESFGHLGFVLLCGHSCDYLVVLLSLN